MYKSKPNSLTPHPQHTTSTPPATTTTTTTTLPTHRLPPAAKPRGGGSCFLPIESHVFGPFFGNPRTVKKVSKNTYVLTPHFLWKKLKQVITKWTKIGHFVRVFGEFKIVEFAMRWDPDVICRGRRYFCKSLLFFDV